MTLKVIHRNTKPDSWQIGKRIVMAGEVLELIEIDGDHYTWIDVCKTNECRPDELALYVP